ncbi:MAG: Rrf2 family transcriptional regulator [Pseudomonadales bacterium]|nr:Rrf2 family transcriptional regulator [Pseudomonadales bacterium]
MRLTTKGRYAVTAMLDMALHGDAAPVSVVDVAQRQGIPGPYLEQLFARLRRSGLIESVRGPGGGYRLGRAMDDVSIADIINAVGEGVDATRCQGAADCREGAQCLTHDLWSALSRQIDEFLRGVTLAGLVRQRAAADGAAPEADWVQRIAARNL